MRMGESENGSNYSREQEAREKLSHIVAIFRQKESKKGKELKNEPKKGEVARTRALGCEDLTTSESHSFLARAIFLFAETSPQPKRHRHFRHRYSRRH